jgi:CubicO group peptidase (beta-lactamase class C family)
MTPARRGRGLYSDTGFQLLASCGGQGAVVSTLRDGVAFVQAFFDGRLFDAALLDEMLIYWHRIFSPLEYGTGVMRFRLLAVLTGFRSCEFQGHSGASGVVFYRDARSGVIVVGTVNQLAQRSLPYQLMIRTAGAAVPGADGTPAARGSVGA